MSRKVAVMAVMGLTCSVAPLAVLRPAMAAAADAENAGTGAGTGAERIEEVIVTARKRAERDIDVPTTVQAFSADMLEKNQIFSVTDLYATVPNLYFSSNALSGGRDLMTLVIRGIGSESAGPPAVATIIDGVYQPSLAFDTQFLDTSSVEVLKGPQGAIFGRNAEAGAVNITTRKPDDTLRAMVAATFDNFNTEQVQGQFSGPLGGDFFGGISLADSHTDGYLTDPTLGGISADRHSRLDGRVALRYKPDNRLDVNLSFDGSEFKGLTGDPGVPRELHDYKVLNNFLLNAHFKSLGSALNVAYQSGNLTFTSITGARRLDSDLPYDFSGGPIGGITYPNELMAMQVHQNILSQEFRLNGESFDKSLHWLSGVYLFQDINTLRRRLSLPFLPALGTSFDSRRQDQHLTDRGVALFADAIYDFATRWSLDLGVRYSDERIKSDFFQDAVIPGIFFADNGVQEEVSSHYVTPTASLLYHITANATGYIRYAQGARAAGFPEAPTPSTNIPYKAEHTYNYEVGTKGRVFDGVLGYNVSAYYIDIKDQQVQSIAYANGNPNLPTAAITNAGRSRSKGAEADFDVKPTDSLLLTANIGYTNARYVTYIDSNGIDRAGEPLPFVPHFTAAATASYTTHVPGNRPLTVTGEYQHVSSILSGSGVVPDLQFRVNGYSLTNLRASLAVTDRFKIDLFVKNVFDKYVETKVFNAYFFDGPRPFSTVLPPRNEGIRLSYSF